MHDFVSALNDFRDSGQRGWHDRREDQEAGTVMDVVINTTRSKIGRAFSSGKKVRAKLKDDATAQPAL